MLNSNQDTTNKCLTTCFGFGRDKQCALCGSLLPQVFLTFFPHQDLFGGLEKSLLPATLRSQKLKTARRSWRRQGTNTCIRSTGVDFPTVCEPKRNPLDEGWQIQTSILGRTLGFDQPKPPRFWGWATVGPKSLYGKYVQTAGPEEDAWFHTMEIMAISFYQACRAKTWADQMVAIAAFAKMTDNPLCPFRMSYATVTALLAHFFPMEGKKVESRMEWMCRHASNGTYPPSMMWKIGSISTRT